MASSGAGAAHGVASPQVVTLVDDYLQDAARHTHAQLGDVAGVAITTSVFGGDPMTAGASTTLAAEVDAMQYAYGHGPCLDALHGRGGAYVPDLARDGRWGRYGRDAAALGARSCLSIPVVDSGSAVLGVVKVYAGRVDGLDERQRETAREFAFAVAGGVGLANTLVATVLELDDRVEAMDTRRTIDLATGILMGRLGCTSDAAFDLMRRESQNANVKIIDVAADLLHVPAPPVDPAATIRRTAVQAPFRRRGEAPVRGR